MENLLTMSLNCDFWTSTKTTVSSEKIKASHTILELVCWWHITLTLDDNHLFWHILFAYLFVLRGPCPIVATAYLASVEITADSAWMTEELN